MAWRLRALASAPSGERCRVSAAQLLGSGAWTLDSASLRIEVAGMGKKMLSLTVNAAAEKIIRQEFATAGRGRPLPGHSRRWKRRTGRSRDLRALAGSIQEAALSNPWVQRAQDIFKAEVRSVVDLRKSKRTLQRGKKR